MKDAKKCIKTKLIVFPENKLFKANLFIWVQKIMCRHHCNCNCNGWTIKIFLIVSTIKRAKRFMETISMVYLKKVSSAQISHFEFLGPKMRCRHNSGWTFTVFFKVCKMKRIKRYIKIISMVFLKKKYLWHNWAVVGSKMKCPYFKSSFWMHDVQTFSHTQFSHTMSHTKFSRKVVPWGHSLGIYNWTGERCPS